MEYPVELLKGNILPFIDESARYLLYNGEVEPTAINEPNVTEEPKAPEKPAFDEDEFSLVGEAFKTYILVEQGKKLLIIDKHAAHERMLFEKFKANRDGIETQMLLAPVTVTLSKEEYSAVLDNLDLLEKAGYYVEDFGGGMVIVNECPTAVADANIEVPPRTKNALWANLHNLDAAEVFFDLIP